MFKEHCFLRFPDFGPSDGRYDVTRLLCVRLSQLRQSLRRDPASAVLSNNAATARTIGLKIQRERSSGIKPSEVDLYVRPAVPGEPSQFLRPQRARGRAPTDPSKLLP